MFNITSNNARKAIDVDGYTMELIFNHGMRTLVVKDCNELDINNEIIFVFRDTAIIIRVTKIHQSVIGKNAQIIEFNVKE